MLAIKVKPGEWVSVGENGIIKVSVYEIRGSKVVLAFDAPKEVAIYRPGLIEKIQATNSNNDKEQANGN